MANIDKIYNCDCLVGMKELADNSVDLVVTSPPYDNLRTYDGIGEGWNFDTFKAIAKELTRVLKDGGVIVWNVNDATINGSETGSSFRQALYFHDECGLNIHDTMIWQKDTLQFPDPTRYGQCFEYMFVFSKGRPKAINLIKDKRNKWAGSKIHGTSRNADGTTSRKHNNNKRETANMGCRFNVWAQPSEKHNTTGHPAVYPVRLPYEHIISWSNENDLVLDPFMGSGTTAIAAIKSHRHFIGYELNKEYYDGANARIKMEQAQLSLF